MSLGACLGRRTRIRLNRFGIGQDEGPGTIDINACQPTCKLRKHVLNLIGLCCQSCLLLLLCVEGDNQGSYFYDGCQAKTDNLKAAHEA